MGLMGFIGFKVQAMGGGPGNPGSDSRQKLSKKAWQQGLCCPVRLAMFFFKKIFRGHTLRLHVLIHLGTWTLIGMLT